MSENTIFVRRYTGQEEKLVTVNERELWRYSGYLGLNKENESLSDELKTVLAQVKKDLEGAFDYKVCYRRMPISWDEAGLPILPWKYNSLDLAKCIKDCDEMVVFAATIGLGIDRQIAKNQRVSPTKALLAQAYGAERIESLCDFFCEDIRKELRSENLFVTPRFSPGYGDLPLECQRDVFRLLDCSRQIGISLGESLLMTPSKSVTAIFGIKKKPDACEDVHEKKCSTCEKYNCLYRED